MNIGGVLKFSTLDYPGKLSSVIFCQGCPLRCVYCHNQGLLDFKASGNIPFDDILDFLKTRNGLLDAVVFSGGEPLLQPDLYESMQKVKDLGFLVGLHTAGSVPNAFEKVLDIVDWVGFDIKTFFSNYFKITQVKNSENQAAISLDYLLKSSVNYEIRTTVDSRNISDEDLIKTAKFLHEKGVKKWVLQECILRNKNTSDLKIDLPSIDILDILNSYIDIEIRRQ